MLRFGGLRTLLGVVEGLPVEVLKDEELLMQPDPLWEIGCILWPSLLGEEQER